VTTWNGVAQLGGDKGALRKGGRTSAVEWSAWEEVRCVSEGPIAATSPVYPARPLRVSKRTLDFCQTARRREYRSGKTTYGTAG